MTTTKTPAGPALNTIDITELDAVTGGCAACGNPNHQPQDLTKPTQQTTTPPQPRG